MTKRLFVVVVTLGFAALVAACAPAAPPPAPVQAAPKVDVAAEVMAIRDLDAQWLKAAQARDAAAEARIIANDGVVYREHVPPLIGPAAFQAYNEKMAAANPKSAINWSTEAIQIAAAGDIAIQTGEYHLTGLGPTGSQQDRGRFVTIWKKVNNEWKVAHDISSTTMSEPVPGKKPS